MTDDERAAWTEEERCCVASLARSTAMLERAAEDIRGWVKMPGAKPPPANVAHAALNVHLDLMALYRIREWRQRFGG